MGYWYVPCPKCGEDTRSFRIDAEDNSSPPRGLDVSNGTGICAHGHRYKLETGRTLWAWHD